MFEWWYGQRHRLRVPVEHPRRERADHEVRPLEGLVRGRRQVEAPGARLEVVGVERVRPDVAVPADHVERVPVEHVVLVAVAHAHGHVELAALVIGLELAGRVEVALRERRVLEQLAVAVAVAVRRLDLAGRVEAEPELLLAHRQLEGVRGPARDHDVVALAERHAAEDRPQDAAAAVDVEDLVALSVPVEAVQGLERLADRDLDVVVPHQEAAAGDGIAVRVDAVRVGEPVDVCVRDPLLPLDRAEVADAVEPAGRLEVEQDRLVAREALVAHDLLDEQRRAVAVRAHLHVSLGGDAAEAGVAHG